MFASAYVNGEHQEKSVHINLPVAPDSANKLLLKGDPRRVPAGGGLITFAAFPQRTTQNWGVTGWLFLPDSGAPRSSDGCPRASSLRTCTDSITQTGTMRVYGFVPTIPNDSADFRVYVGGSGLLTVTGPGTYNPAGELVTFTASASGAKSFAVTNWAFHADSAGAGSTTSCGTTETCTFLPSGAGYVVAAALVDGEEQVDSTHTTPEIIRLMVTASATLVDPGTAVTFTAAPKTPATVVISGWKFSPDSGAATAAVGCTSSSANFSCVEKIGRSGQMWTYGSVNTRPDSAYARVDVRSAASPPGCEPAPSCGGAGTTRVVIEQKTPGLIPPAETFYEPTAALSVKLVDAAGAAVPNVSVALVLKGVAGTGGHVHEGSNGEPRPDGALNHSTVNTGSTGVATVIYTANNVATDVLVTGTSASATSGTLTLKIGLNLVDITDVPAGAKARFDMIGGTPWHPVNHFGLHNMRASLYALSDAYQEVLLYFQKHPERAPSGRLPTRLGLNDVSLPTGGRFDLSRTWKQPHVSHRKGYDADLDVRRESSDDALARLITRLWVLEWKNAIKDERQSSNHYHLKMSDIHVVSPSR
ncbi:MAG: hypothetical protein LH467_06530 [Gemmatimonadaceae bacterium]|nr:hypothetical protein [Gemmatimonadaceae bacterium]